MSGFTGFGAFSGFGVRFWEFMECGDEAFTALQVLAVGACWIVGEPACHHMGVSEN